MSSSLYKIAVKAAFNAAAGGLGMQTVFSGNGSTFVLENQYGFLPASMGLFMFGAVLGAGASVVNDLLISTDAKEINSMSFVLSLALGGAAFYLIPKALNSGVSMTMASKLALIGVGSEWLSQKLYVMIFSPIGQSLGLEQIAVI